MKDFTLVQATSIEDAVTILKKANGATRIMAGGTDLLGGLKRRISPVYPDVVLSLRTVSGLNYIKEEDGFLKIGAMTTLRDIAENAIVSERYAALAEAAQHTASPHLRNMGTLAGNLCQETRCWYYRGVDNFFPCKMKGGKKCYAPGGDNRYHSVFKGVDGCFSVNPSDTAPAIVAFDGIIQTTKRTIDAVNFWKMSPAGSTVLESDEIVTEIRMPIVNDGTKSAFTKFANRETIDFPIVNCAVVHNSDSTRICLNAVHPHPYRALAAEAVLAGHSIDEAIAEKAGEAAIAGAVPLSGNKYKVQLVRAIVARTVLACK